MRELRVNIDAEGLEDSGTLEPSKHGGKRGEIGSISGFERFDVLHAEISIYHQRQQLGAQQDESRERASDAAVTILIAMDLRKAMMEPGRHYDWVFGGVLSQPGKQVFELRFHVQWRAILVSASVRAARIVWKFFELAPL